VLEYFAQVRPCLIGMEACSGAHYWARELSKLGHTVKLMAPQFVIPYREGGKNEINDAEAICEAVGGPDMHFVAAKTEEQQAVLMVHRARRLVVTNRTALTNHSRRARRVRPGGAEGRDEASCATAADPRGCRKLAAGACARGAGWAARAVSRAQPAHPAV
jgi:transposase